MKIVNDINRQTLHKDKRRTAKDLSEMTLEELWQLFPIILEGPNRCWVEWFEYEKRFLETNLPMNKVSMISHIGSTSVQTICAKPTVDIFVEVCDNVQISDVAKSVIDCGYLLMSDEGFRMSFNKGYTSSGFAERVFHLHLRNKNDNDELYFRDYLIDHTDTAKEYEKLKIKLWEKYEHNRDKYTESKTDFVKKYSEKAKKLYKGRYC